MKSKNLYKKLLGSIVFLLGTGALASAQNIPLNVYSNYNPNYGEQVLINQMMMGTVVLPGGNYPVPMPQQVLQVPTNIGTCDAFLTSFHKFGDMDNEVVLLQKFLNEYNGANLNGLGYFGKATMKEVQNFQYAFGIKTTGSQYEKTTDIINKIKCGLLEVKKERIVYTAHTSNVVTNTNYMSNSAKSNFGKITSAKNIPQSDVYPKGVIDSVPSSSSYSTTSSGFPTFQDDFDRIKENYKAYLLVFVLVLALFWFLRKAATE